MEPGEGKYDKANQKSNQRLVTVGLVLLVPIFGLSWLSTGMQKEQRLEYVYLAYDFEGKQARGYVKYRSESAVMLPEASYPMGFVLIHTDAIVARYPSGQYSSTPGKVIGDLKVNQKFYLVISDGEGDRFSSEYFRYPRYQAGSGIIEKMDYVVQINEVMFELGGYSALDVIGDARRIELLTLTHEALADGEYAWISEAIREGRYSRSQVGRGVRKFLLVGLGFIGLFFVMIVLDRLLSRRFSWWKARRMKKKDDVLG